MMDEPADEIAFAGPVVEWRGPAPFYFVELPAKGALTVHLAAEWASYGWGCVPVVATIRRMGFRTSLIPRNGGYLLPLKAAGRRPPLIAPAEQVEAVLRAAASRAGNRRG